ncbi:peptidase s41 family protein [Metarhizium robertsii ARSEF 23]|uniref:Peptidase s41 family protein n=1 Tax=Metarhizium robertsii (strain ARSEF 23 / ATCC MYA-3075) TaxID=655844 RepID=E9FCL8_METRA|nr:peptidase s41 family protein [Metarhizium robertsii ARSEF 23]EFY94525.1 peptidase s41 family protein [Metarhizium robertsii ARSEF 23]
MRIHVLLVAGTAHAAFRQRWSMQKVINAPSSVVAADSRQASQDPCAMISKAFEAAARNKTSDGPIILDLRPSVGTACRKSLPVMQKANLELLDYLRPYVEFQSTIELLKDPPPEYLLPGVDIMGAMQAIRQKLENNSYESQLDVMTDLHNIFVAASDNHFGYLPGLFSAFRYARLDLNFRSISTDGFDMPQIFDAQDLKALEDKTYTPSPVATIDDQEVYEFLEKESMGVPQGHQDPDAKLNLLFDSIPLRAAGGESAARLSILEIPDSYTIAHKNGTLRTVTNSIVTLPDINLKGIRSGQEFQKRFEIPPRNQQKPRPKPQTPPPAPPGNESALVNYPTPLVKHSDEFVASYALNDTEMRDTMVISFLSFVSLAEEDITANETSLSSFVRQFGDVIDQTAKAAKEQGRDKLIIDMSANSGGSLDLTDFAYTTFFPGARFDSFDRYRVNSGLNFLARAASPKDVLGFFVAPEGLPIDAANRTIDSPDALFSPRPIQGQNMTAEFRRDASARYFIKPDVFLRGYEPNKAAARREPPWKPENMVILTDGLCASACTIFTGLLVRNFGIRTIALGGRPLNKPMQAIGGVKGTQVLSNAEIKKITADAVRIGAGQARRQRARSIPSVRDAPLLPLMEEPGSGGSVNLRNGYSQDDVDGFPLHFKYQAANCRLFYTSKMLTDVAETWRRAALVAFRNGTCVPGSTVNSDGTMGAKAPGFDPDVRGRAPGVPMPTLE